MNDELYIGGELIDLGEQTVIAITKQVNDIASLQGRQGILSNKFKVPKTSENRKKLGFSDTVESTSAKPYTKNTARYVQAGEEIIPDGYAIVEEASDYFMITVYSGNSEFFAEIDGLKLQDLPLDELDHVWDKSTIISLNTATEDVIYPIIDYNERIVTASDPQKVFTDSLYLALFKHSLAKRIVEAKGWTLDIGGLAQDERYMNDLLLFSNDKYEHNDAYALAQQFYVILYSDYINQYGLTYTGPGTFPTQGNIDILPVPFNLETVAPAFDNGNNYNEIIYRAEIQTNGTYAFTAHIEGTYDTTPPAGTLASSGFTTYTLSMRKNGTTLIGTVTNVIGNLSGPFSGMTVENTLPGGQDFVAGDYIEVRFYVSTQAVFYDAFPTGNVITTNDGYVDIVLESDECFFKSEFSKSIKPGSFIHVADHLPDMTQIEFLKAYFNQYAISPDGNSSNKTLVLRSWKELLDSVPVADDWTDLYVAQTPTIQYRFGNYYQKNDFVYKQDFGIPIYYGNGSFDISDEVLDPRGTVVELPYGSSIASLQTSIKQDGVVQHVISINNQSNKGKISPRCAILRRYDMSDGVLYNDASGNTNETTSLPFCHFELEGFDGLHFNELIEDYYPVVVSSLQNCKHVTCLLKMSSIHVSRIDHFKAVYLEQFAAYFYRNVIRDFKSGQLTRVELIRI